MSRAREPGLIGSTAYSKIPTPPYNYMVICRTSNAPTRTPVGHATPRSCVVLRTPVHVTSPATLHGFNSRYDADPVGWIERYENLECVELDLSKCVYRAPQRQIRVCIVRLRERLGIRKHACNRNGANGVSVYSLVNRTDDKTPPLCIFIAVRTILHRCPSRAHLLRA